jgi:hypothetical protein
MKHVLIYSPEAIHKCALDLTLELAETRLREGCEVTLIHCTGDLRSCYSNPYHRGGICTLCRSTFWSGYACLGRKRSALNIEHFHPLTATQRERLQELREEPPESFSALKELTIEGADIGLAAYSSLIDAALDSEPNFEEYRELMIAKLIGASTVYYSFSNRFAASKPDEFLLFGGRNGTSRPALRAAQRLGVSTEAFEYLERPDAYILIENTYPHDLGALKRYLLDVYENSPLSDDEKLEAARRWFIRKRSRAMPDWMNYTKSQRSGRLPASLLKDRCKYSDLSIIRR